MKEREKEKEKEREEKRDKLSTNKQLKNPVNKQRQKLVDPRWSSGLSRQIT